jgi:hypothetical protein
MISPGAVSLAVALAAGCTAAAEPPFADKGRAVWTEMPGAPPMTYHAVWGAGAGDVLAAGDGGIAHFDGDAWRPVDGVPATTYRAVWGRSPSEVWIGGDGVLLARSLTGWQAQALFDGSREITDYSVLALGGGSLREYAVVRTGGKLLLLVNQGSAWETPLWRGASGPTLPFLSRPSLVVHGQRLLLAGDGELVEAYTSSDLGVPMWEAHPWRNGQDLPPVSSISGGPGFWVAAGGPSVVVLRDAEYEPEIASSAARPRDARAVFASRANRFFVVGDPVGAPASAVEACDEDGCVLERVDAAGGPVPLRAIWGDQDGTVIAAGDGVIVERVSGGGRRCREP